MEVRLRKMFQWVSDDSLCSPRNSIGMLPEEQRTLRIRRRQMCDSYEACNKLIGLYERSYDAFVENDNPQAFIGFLDNSERSYLTLSTHVSIATHCLNLWEQYIYAFGLSLRNSNSSSCSIPWSCCAATRSPTPMRKKKTHTNKKTIAKKNQKKTH